ncbi:MAG: hypothetical protein EOM50_23485 [Erysipelotrichia bacterium]|nr:hypothetical protein [Erysipelotrichia bacterium]
MTITINDHSNERITQRDAFLVINHIINQHTFELGRLSKGFLETEMLLKEQLKAKDAEITLLKQCVEEAIKRPMGVEPSIYSDYKDTPCA